MSDWDVITNAVKQAIGLANPGGLPGVATVLADTGLFSRTVPGQARPESPAPGGGALPPAPAPLPPPPGGSATGAAAEAGQAAADQVKAFLADLEVLDKDAAATVQSIHAAGVAGAQALDEIQKGVEAKIAELGPRLDTPAGQQELRNFLTEKLTAAKTVLEAQMADAEKSALATHDITTKYADLAGGTGGAAPPVAPGGGSGGTGEGSGGGSSGGGSTAGSTGAAGGGQGGGQTATTPAAVPPAPGTQTAAAPVPGVQPAGFMPGGMGMMPGMGMPGMGMPSFGGMPGIGGGADPLAALSGLSGLGGAHDPAAAGAAFHDDPAAAGGSDSGGGAPKLHEDSPGAAGGDAGTGTGTGTGTGEGHRGAEFHDDAGTRPAGASEQGGGAAGQSDGSSSTTAHPSGGGADQPPLPAEAGGDHPATLASGQQTTGTHLTLPDGTTAEARTDAGANAVRSALNGTPVADAYRQAGVELPPPGTPVTDPLPPTKLQAGDIGVWKDHMVMALGGGKVLVSGQVQPQSSLGSGPDFLGWINPTAHDHPASAPAAAPAPVNPVPPVTNPGSTA